MAGRFGSTERTYAVTAIDLIGRKLFSRSWFNTSRARQSCGHYDLATINTLLAFTPKLFRTELDAREAFGASYTREGVNLVGLTTHIITRLFVIQLLGTKFGTGGDSFTPWECPPRPPMKFIED